MLAISRDRHASGDFMKETMPEKIHLWPEEIVADADAVTVAAVIESPGGARQRLWYRLPAAHRAAITGSCDPFLLGIIFRVMKDPLDLHIHGQVSPTLLRNLVEFMEAWKAWRPGKYHRIEISADEEREQTGLGTGPVIMGFSGGCDSTFTAWRHRSGHAGRQQADVVAGVMVHGFDIPLDQPDVFDRAAQKARLTLASVGMELIPVATNFREMGGNWDDAHGAGVASCLMLLQGRYSAGLIACGYKYSDIPIPPYGTNPITDWMLSGGTFRIVTDGAAYTKIEKIKLFNEWPEATKYLRVCWSGEYKDRNCCRCQKCVVAMLSFRLLGLPLPESFERDISDQEIMRLRYHDQGQIRSMRILAWRARKAKVRASWVRALEFSVWNNRLRLALMERLPLRSLARRVYRLFLPPF
jgi:hypothetical protein